MDPFVRTLLWILDKSAFVAAITLGIIFARCVS